MEYDPHLVPQALQEQERPHGPPIVDKRVHGPLTKLLTRGLKARRPHARSKKKKAKYY